MRFARVEGVMVFAGTGLWWGFAGRWRVCGWFGEEVGGEDAGRTIMGGRMVGGAEARSGDVVYDFRRIFILLRRWDRSIHHSNFTSPELRMLSVSAAKFIVLNCWERFRRLWVLI